MKITTILLGFLTMLFLEAGAQENISKQKATLVITADFMKEVPSIADQIATGQFKPAVDVNKTVNPKLVSGNRPVPGKGLPVGPDPLLDQQREAMNYPAIVPSLTFTSVSANVTPTDPTGAVGPDHYVNSWNSSFRIWDKSGNPLTSAASLGTIFPGQTMGDPIVIYDQVADRFLITEFFQNGFLVAICQGSDPVNDGWYTYQFSTSSFPDYPKFSLWSDGYYITANKDSGSAGSSEVVFVIERDKLIDGDPTAQMVGFPLTGITTSGFYSPLGFNVNGSQMPPAGDAPIVYMQDDVWAGVSNDHLKIWTIDVDWDTAANSTISGPTELTTEPFDGLFDGGSFSNLPQPSGPDLDALQATIMFMAQYRRFSDHNSVVFNFVVDLDGNDDYSGIRWYELRQTNDGDPWSIYQEGTYSQPDGHSAYSGTMCIDADGNIALAYSVVSSTQNVSLRFTGRYSTDSLNVMTIDEGTIIDGTSYDPSNRYGDYSQMTIDPVDDKTFWATGEYFTSTSRKNEVGVFKLAPDFSNDVGVVSIDAPVNGTLSDADTVKVTLRNFGAMAQYDIPVSYQINEGTAVTELYTDTLPPNTNAQFTFTNTGDFSTVGETYQITAFSELPSDENTSNDTIVGFVTYLYPDNLGITSLLSPLTDSQLTDNEPITVTIENAGGEPQWNFDVTYVLDDSTQVTEQVADTLPGTQSMEYTFIATGDFSEIGDHTLTVFTSLEGDSDSSNDTISEIITNVICQPPANCNEGDGIARFELGTIVNPSGCDPNGYGDYSDMMTNLWPGATDELVITTNYGSQHIRVWVDLDDDFLFEDEEVIIEDYVIADGQGGGTYTEWIPFPIPGNDFLGEHLLRAKTNWNAPVPEDACEGTEYGETEDYTVNIDNTTGIANQSKEPNELVITESSPDYFTASFKALEINEPLFISVHNISGQTLIHHIVEPVNGTYRYGFDMSFATPGVYLVRLGSDNFGKVKKIVVR